MKVPPEFGYLVLCCHQDVDLEASSVDEIVRDLVGFLDAHHRRVVERFLEELLSRNPTDTELWQFSRDQEPDWGFSDGAGVRTFFKSILKGIERTEVGG